MNARPRPRLPSADVEPRSALIQTGPMLQRILRVSVLLCFTPPPSRRPLLFCLSLALSSSRQPTGMPSAGHEAAGLAVFTPTAYTADYWSPIVASFFFLSTMALSTMLSKRIPRWGSWLSTPPARLAIVVLLADSYVLCLGEGGEGTDRSWACTGWHLSSPPGSSRLASGRRATTRYASIAGVRARRRRCSC